MRIEIWRTRSQGMTHIIILNNAIQFYTKFGRETPTKIVNVHTIAENVIIFRGSYSLFIPRFTKIHGM